MISRKATVGVFTAFVYSLLPLIVFAQASGQDTKQQVGSSSAIVLSMDAGFESWGGDVTYRVGFPVTDTDGTVYYGHFPFSELSFPLDVFFGVVEADVLISDRLQLGMKVKTNVSGPDNYLEDSDWITLADPDRLDVYSESSVTDFSALIIDTDVSYRFLHNDTISLSAGIGYMYQNFEYEAAVIRQWSPSGYTGYDFIGDGTPSIIYDVESDIPYVSISGSLRLMPSVEINGRFALAPWIRVTDEDQHLLKDKVNRGDLDGSAVMLTLDASYDITPYLFVAAGLDYTYIDADGDMDASFSGIYDHTLAEEFESNQSAVYATIGFRLGVVSQR